MRDIGLRGVILLFIAGGLGTLARYGLSGWLQPANPTLPWGTLTANIAGAFVLGVLMHFLTGTTALDAEVRVALTVGFCGGFTTMSTFSYETVTLLADGGHLRAMGYVTGSIGGSLAAVVAGMSFAGRLL